MKKELFMKMSVTEKIFTIIFEEKTKSKDFAKLLGYYNINKHDLYSIMWEEFNIPGMEIRIANTVIWFFNYKMCWEKELDKVLKNEIRECILTAGNFYTNVAPEACTTSDFKLPVNSI